MTDDPRAREFAPCPLCKQYSHSIGGDQLAEAFNHFQSMYAHPLRGHPMGHNFDERTRDAAQVLMAAARSACAHSPPEPQPAEVRERIARISETLSLFPSVIKSGESWSVTCQQVLDSARSDLAILGSAFAGGGAQPFADETELAAFIERSLIANDQEASTELLTVAVARDLIAHYTLAQTEAAQPRGDGIERAREIALAVTMRARAAKRPGATFMSTDEEVRERYLGGYYDADASVQSALSALSPPQPSEAVRDSLCRLLERKPLKRDLQTGIPLGSDVEALVDDIFAALKSTGKATATSYEAGLEADRVEGLKATKEIADDFYDDTAADCYLESSSDIAAAIDNLIQSGGAPPREDEPHEYGACEKPSECPSCAEIRESERFDD